MNQVGIFGSSGMAREVGDIAWALGLEPFYVARDKVEQLAWKYSEDIVLEEKVGSDYPNLPFVIGIGENSARRKVAELYRRKIRFINLIHPSATFGRGQKERIESREGVIVAAGSRFTSNVEVGNFTIFNQNITVAHDCIIDEYAHVAPGANISGNVHLGAECWIGSSAVINQGRNGQKLIVGAGAIIGSGTVVTNDCEPRAVYVGVPARRIR